MYCIDRSNVKFKVNGDQIQEIFFNSAYSSGDKKVDKGKAILYKAQNAKEAVVFIHGTGTKNFNYLKYYPKLLSQNGYTTIMPVLPYHFERAADINGKKSSFLKSNDEDMKRKFCQAVVDIMTCIDYLQKIGFKNIHIMGFSFGGMIASIVMAIDKRIDKGIFVVTGGNFEYITWHSIATKVLRISYEDNENCDAKRCHQIHLKFNKIAKNFIFPDSIENMPVCFRYDPSMFAKLINPNKVIMFTALFDSFIPRKASNDLWTRIGKPKRYFLFSGHLTSHVFYKKLILKKTLEFLNK